MPTDRTAPTARRARDRYVRAVTVRASTDARRRSRPQHGAVPTDPIVSYMRSVDGECSVCGEPLKWQEIRLLGHDTWRDEVALREVTMVCRRNHRVISLGPGGAGPPSA